MKNADLLQEPGDSRLRIDFALCDALDDTSKLGRGE